MSPLLLQVCCPFSELFLIITINNLYLQWTFICSSRGELHLTRALGGRPMASGGGGPRRLVSSRGGGWAGDVQSHRLELGGRGARRQLREAGDVGGRLVERVGWRRSWATAKGGERQCPGLVGCGPREAEPGRAAVDGVGAGGVRKRCRGQAPTGRRRVGRQPGRRRRRGWPRAPTRR
jgi:hypothetical protein